MYIYIYTAHTHIYICCLTHYASIKAEGNYLLPYIITLILLLLFHYIEYSILPPGYWGQWHTLRSMVLTGGATTGARAHFRACQTATHIG